MSGFNFQKFQNPDGGFPASGKQGNPSCLNDTCFWIGKLIEDASEEARESLRKACEWVLCTQSEEGAFVEPEGLASIANLPPWVPPGKPAPIMPQLAAYLLRAGYGDREDTRRAVTYLMSCWRNYDGSFKSRYLVWSMVEVLRRIGLPERSELVQEALKATRRYFEQNVNDIPAFVWCISSLRSAGFTKDHELVKWVFMRLMMLRNEDGGWPKEDLGEKIKGQTDPTFTKTVLDELQAYGLI